MSITFTATPYSITIDNFQPGYTVDVVLPLHSRKLLNGKMKTWDDGSAYDRRILRAKTLISAAQHADIMDFFFDTNKGRCQNVTMALGASSTGFFPAGPDKGDLGNFVVFPLSIKTGQILQQPWLHFSDEMEFLIVSVPSYSLPATTNFSQGDFTLGSVSGLMQPQTGFNPETTPALAKQYTGGMQGGYVDKGYGADTYLSKFSIQANHPKMAQLINYMTSTARGASFSITNQANLYPLGGHFPDSWASYNVKLANETIVVSHTENTFETSFDVIYESAV